MFDDLRPGQNSGSTAGQSPVPTNQPAKNPTIDDIFAGTDPTPEKPSAIQAGVVKPISKTTVPEPIVRTEEAPKIDQSMMQPANMSMSAPSSSAGAKKPLIILVAVLLVAIVSYGAYYFFFRDSGLPAFIDKNENSNIANENTNELPGPTDEDLDDDSDGLTNAEEEQLGTNPLETDTDNDGLFDREEVKSFKTDPIKADTDSDGLSDYNEIKVWFTDPLEKDTDGDTYGDGEEVMNGYDPLGSGRLTNMQGEIKYGIYLDPIFAYSIPLPEEWVDIYETEEEPVFYTSVKFMPNVGSIEYINVRVVKIDYSNQEEFRNVLPKEFSWEEYTLADKPAYISSNKTKVMLYLPGQVDLEQSGLVYSLSYEGSEYSGGVYMGVFQYMLDNFVFAEN